ncbi:GAP family protein [Actinomyces ruminicola]|uniref:Sap, sulfolipid-1-addressing protein n=1 Tax=Actinomyces ruminicola TaxID=332524 RepID=A0A1H0CYZ9_9ACTO|nr:GAP family protein [Actinomyces ruminicola]SDM61696.1 Sap, sulfolipid-1-addressing protein [Actinomyces ruminicola]SDN63026.1 Sap, sulfolipid-1-addressing protein [Actinomyces ruminicola]
MGDLLALVGLALLDSTSLGTLVIPLGLVVRRRRVDPGPMSVYFLTVCTVYAALGLALMAGIDVAAGVILPLTRTDAVRWLGLVLGAGLALFGILAPNPKKPSASDPERSTARPAPIGLGSTIALGLGAALTEAATMVPYIAATGIIAGMDLGWGGRLVVLVGYCLVMIMPAGVLIGVAALYGERLFGRLERMVPRLEYEAKVTLLWIAAIIGLRMAAINASALGLLGD